MKTKSGRPGSNLYKNKRRPFTRGCSDIKGIRNTDIETEHYGIEDKIEQNRWGEACTVGLCRQGMVLLMMIYDNNLIVVYHIKHKICFTQVSAAWPTAL